MKFIALALALSKSVRGLDYPIGITNCGVFQQIDEAPKRAVTMNQGATEVMLALDLADRMAGTAYLDDYIWPELSDAYNQIPVLNEKYPNITELMAVEPDFVYASYSSAFSEARLNYSSVLGIEEGECSLMIQRSNGENRTHCREELHDFGIQTYLSKPYCELTEHQPDETTLDVLYNEIYDVASIFGAFDNARVLVDSIQGHFDDALRVASTALMSGIDPIKVLWLDGWDDETPFVGACCGSVQTIIERSGAENILEDQGVDGKKSWDSVSWDTIEAKDPDLIVLIDASWDEAHEKIFKLCSNEQTRKLRAVQNRAFIQVPFSASTLGVRIGALAYNLAEAFTAIVQGEALPSLQFTPTSIADDGSDSSPQVLAKSGIRVFDSLPTWNGTDLNELCPGSNTGVQIREDIPLASAEELAEQVETLAAEKVTLENTVNDANVKVSDLETVNKALEETVDDVTAAKDLLEKEVNDANVKVSDLETVNESLENTVDDVTREKDLLAKEVEELNAQIEGIDSGASVMSFGLAAAISLLTLAF